MQEAHEYTANLHRCWGRDGAARECKRESTLFELCEKRKVGNA